MVPALLGGKGTKLKKEAACFRVVILCWSFLVLPGELSSWTYCEQVVESFLTLKFLFSGRRYDADLVFISACDVVWRISESWTDCLDQHGGCTFCSHGKYTVMPTSSQMCSEVCCHTPVTDLAKPALKRTWLWNFQRKPSRIQKKMVLGIQQMAPLPLNHFGSNVVRVHGSACGFLRWAVNSLIYYLLFKDPFVVFFEGNRRLRKASALANFWLG